MLDQNKFVWDQFKGVWFRGSNLGDPYVSRGEEVPEGYNPSALNVIFSNHGVQNRPGWLWTFGPYTPDIYVVWPVFTGSSCLILNTNGDLYQDNTLLIASFTPSISGSLGLDIQVLALPRINFLGNAVTYLVSGTNGNVIIFNAFPFGSPTRNAAGIPPATGPTVATGAAGRIELGLHLIAVVYETDSGFITQFGPAFAYTSPGAVQANLTVVPLGPAGTVKRHIVATKVIRNYNGDTKAYEYFFIPGATINDNVTTTITVNFYDTELVSSADYLLDINSSLSLYRLLGTYAGRAVYATSSILYETELVVSEVAQYETVNLVDNVLNIDKVITAWEYDGSLYVSTSYGVWGFRDNGGPANTWERFLVDSDIICLGTSSVSRAPDGTTAMVNGSIPVITKNGIYAFTGKFGTPLTYGIEGLYKNFINSSDLKSNIRIQVDIDTKSFIVTGFKSSATPGNGQVILYCDYNNGLDSESVRWSLWLVPFTTYLCPPIISSRPFSQGFLIGAGKNAYEFRGLNVDEDKTTGVIVKSAISGFVTTPVLKMSNDYSLITVSTIRTITRIDNNSPNTQNGFYVGLNRANLRRNYVLDPADGIIGINVFNFNKSFERDEFIWGFSTQESPSGYKAIELIQAIFYWTLRAQNKIAK